MGEVENYTGKPISEFTETDTLYMRKMSGGFAYTFFVRFKSVNGGTVCGEIIDIQPNNIKSVWVGKTLHKVGEDISNRLTKCYTFKQKQGCCWFYKEGKDYICKK